MEEGEAKEMVNDAEPNKTTTTPLLPMFQKD
jgi:hypothetical protein